MSDRWEKLLEETPQTMVTPAATGAAPPPPTEAPADAYAPWGQEHGDTHDIEIRRRNGEWFQLREPFITGVEGIGDRVITLKTTFGAVTLEGNGLAELRTLLRHRKVDFIQEFDAGRWPRPAADAPKIERIEIIQARAARPSSEPLPRR